MGESERLREGEKRRTRERKRQKVRERKEVDRRQVSTTFLLCTGRLGARVRRELSIYPDVKGLDFGRQGPKAFS